MGSLVRLGFLFLLWNIGSSFAVVSDVVSSDPIVDTQDKLLKTQIEIIRINSGTINTDSLNDIKARLSVIEGEFKKLNELSDLRRGQANGSCDVALAMQMLMNHYSSIDGQLKSLQAAVSERAQVDDQKASLKDIMEAIKSNHFNLAEEKFIQLGDISLIPKIVHEVYANSEENFDILVNFSKALSKITPTYEVLKSLYNEMLVNTHQDPMKLISLAEALQSEVTRQHNDPNGIKNDANTIVNGLVDTIKTTVTEFLVTAMKASDYQLSADVHIMAASLYVFRPELSDEVMQRVIDGTYGTVKTDTILDNIFSHSITAQAISGIIPLFWKMNSDGNLNSDTVMNLALDLSKLQERSEYATLSQERKDAVNKVVENIPTCARNLFFKPSVCLWNKAKDTYLLAANSSLNHDADRRNILTYSPPKNASLSQDVPTGASWFVETIGTKILFKSTKYTNEYLYVAAIDYDTEKRYVFNWIRGNNIDDQSAFKIELDGDNCHLKSLYFNEYLYASDVKHKKDGSYSYVFTWKPGTLGENSDFVWQIRSC